MSSTLRAAVHREWQKDLVTFLAPIVWCELCGTTDPGPPGKFDHAHRVKKRFIGYETERDHDEYMMAAKLCRKCHISLDENWNKEEDDDFDAHRHMHETITELCRKRTFDIQVA